MMASTGGAKENVLSKMGIFKIQGNKINGRPHYINKDNMTMYWMGSHNGFWMVIPRGVQISYCILDVLVV